MKRKWRIVLIFFFYIYISHFNTKGYQYGIEYQTITVYSLIWLQDICNANSLYNFQNQTNENHVVNRFTIIYMYSVHIQLQSKKLISRTRHPICSFIVLMFDTIQFSFIISVLFKISE